MKKLLAFALSLTLVFTLAACGGENGDEEEGYIDLGPNYEGARIGLVVPDYVDIDSVDELNDHSDDFSSDYSDIVGIESGAGIMEATDTAIEDYDLDMSLQTSSGPAMVSTLGDAIEDKEWVVVTGWTPHYKFAEYDLKFLEDPEGVYGEEEDLHTIARPGLEDDDADLVEFLENFYMEDEELGDLMGDIADNEDDDTIDIARDWMADNEDVWEEWIPEGMDGDGAELEIPYVNWAEGVAMTHLVQAILNDELNYDAEVTQADAGPIFRDVSSGDSDFFLDAWLPVTHESYQEEYEAESD